jgi:hypothetical protein
MRRGAALVSAILFAAGGAHAATVDLHRDETASAAPEGRRVWVLSDPDGYGSGNRPREIVVYDLTCESGKLVRISEGAAVASGPKLGQGWVIRTPSAPDEAIAQEQLQRSLADICGI